MSNYASLKATINANIKQNNNQEITGPILNSVLNAMVTTLGAGYGYVGVATPSTNPGTPDNKVFYLASTAGTYTNFGGLVLSDGEIAILKWDTAWHKDTTGIASTSVVSQLAQKVGQVNLVAMDIPEMEYGTLNNSGQEVSSTANVRTKGYIRAPFCMTLKSGYKFTQVWMYDKSGDTYTFVRKMGTLGYEDSLKVFVSQESHYYRVVVNLNNTPIDSPNDVIDTFESVNERKRDDGIDELNFVNDIIFPLLPGVANTLSLGTLSDGRMSFETAIGEIRSSTSVHYTRMIPIVSGKKYRVTTKINLAYDAGVAYYNAAQITPANFMGLDKSFIGDGSTNSQIEISGLLTIPAGATHFVVFTRNSSNISVKEITLSKVASESQLDGKVDKIPGKGLSTNDFTDTEKNKLDSLDPTIVPVEIIEQQVEEYLDGHSGGLIPQNRGINLVPTYTYKLDPSILTNPGTLPTGWSGDLSNGFEHTSGNTDALEFDLSGYSVGDEILVTFDATGITSESNELYVSQGTKSLIKSYNGGSHFVAGFINDGNALKLTPTSAYAGVVTNLKARKIDVDNGTETLSVTENNLYTERKKLVAGFWDVIIGPDSTLLNAEDVTRSIGIGFCAMRDIVVGNRNVAIGTYAMAFTKEADNNVAIGSDTLYPTAKSAKNCVAIGKAALSGTGEMEDCIAIGNAVMAHYGLSTNRSRCVCIGGESGYDVTSKCTHIGYRSGRNSNGANNTSVGYNSLGILERTTVDITGTELTCIGYNASVANNATAKAATNSTAIGANATITKSNQVVIGDANVTELIFGNKKILFNNDNSVTWETIS